MIDTRTYLEDIKKQLSELLALRKDATDKDERAVQLFFEKYPSALLGALEGVESYYNIFSGIVISQPRLKSFDGDKQPDFLIVTWNSLNLYFNFIEIEDPSKKIYTGSSQQPSNEFKQAVGQLMQWSSFGKDEVVNYCKELLKSLFKDNFNNQPDKMRHYNYILVYGFSDEILNLGERHNHLLQEYFVERNKHHCTFSRLLSNTRFDSPLFTVKKEAETNRFKAIGFVPFKDYGVHDWSDLHNIIGKQELIRVSANLMTDDEKDILIKRIDELDSKTLQEIIDINLADNGFKKI
jgi:hypothetical protein